MGGRDFEIYGIKLLMEGRGINEITHGDKANPRIKFQEQQDLKVRYRNFPGGTVVKNPPANAGDMGSIPGPGRSHMPRSN